MLCGKTHVAINYMHAPDYVLQRRWDIAGLSHDVCCESTLPALLSHALWYAVPSMFCPGRAARAGGHSSPCQAGCLDLSQLLAVVQMSPPISRRPPCRRRYLEHYMTHVLEPGRQLTMVLSVGYWVWFPEVPHDYLDFLELLASKVANVVVVSIPTSHVTAHTGKQVRRAPWV